MSSIKGQIIWTAASAGCLLYFFATYNPDSKTKEQTKYSRIDSQVSFRDPKQIEEHKKKLEEMNKKIEMANKTK